MSTIDFVNTTIVPPSWLNDVDALTYQGVLPTGVAAAMLISLGLPASDGSSLIGLQRTDIANAVSTTLQLWHNRQWWQVTDLMTASEVADVRAKTYTVDLTTKLQSCFNALTAGQVLVFPPGGYKTLGSLTLDVSDVQVLGYGATIRNSSNNATTPTMDIGVNPSTVDRVRIAGFNLETNNQCGDHLRMTRTTHSKIEDCRSASGNQSLLAMVGDCYGNTVFQCHADGMTGFGFRTLNSGGGTVNNSNYFRDCTAINCAGGGIDFQGANDENIIEGGYYEGNTGVQLQMLGGRGNRISKVYVEQGTTGTPTDFIKLGAYGGSSNTSTVLSGNIFGEVASGAKVINLDAANDCAIDGNDYSGSREFLRINTTSERTRIGRMNRVLSASPFKTDNGFGTIDDRENARIVMFDDFIGPALDANKWSVSKGSDGACVNFVKNSGVSPGGIIRGTTGAGAGATMAVNGIQVLGDLDYKAGSGALAVEGRIAMSATTNISVFIGLTDQKAALEAPITGSGAGDGITTNASDAVGWLYDTSMTNQKWWAVGVAADVDATAQNSTLVPTGGTMETFRVEVNSVGSAIFYRNGVKVGSTMTGAVTAGVQLTPVITAFARAAASRNIDADLHGAAMNR